MELKPGCKHTEVGVIPDDWDLFHLRKIMTFQNGFNADRKAYGQGIRFINVLEVINLPHITTENIPGCVLMSKSSSQNFSIKKGDIVFNRTSETQKEVGLASVYIGDELVTFGGFVIRGRVRLDRFHESYRAYALRSEMIRAQITAKGQGAVRANIGQFELGNVLLPLPPKAEQEAIAGALSDTDALIEALEQLITKKRHIKQGAMLELLTGKKRLPGFETKPSTQQTEVGEIPADWQLPSFEDVFDFLRSATYSRSDTSSEYQIFYLHYGDIHTKFQNEINFDKNPLKGVSDKLGKGYPFLCEGDLVMADASEDMEGVGKSVEVKNIGENKAIAGLHTFLLRPKKSKKLAPGFSGYLQSNPLIIRQQHCLATGMKVFGLSRSNLKMVKIPLPKIAEQEAIAAVLSDMDAEICALETKLSKARHIKQGMMAELLTGRIRLI